MMSEGPRVFLVEDDEAVRLALSTVLATYGMQVETFASAEDFLARAGDPGLGCLVTDVRMPGLSGLDLQRRVRERGWILPIIVITGHGDVPMAIEAMKEGAADFLEKPVDDSRLADAIRAATADAERRRARHAHVEEARARHARLTPREREVMDLVVAGQSSPSIAARLEISQRTVEHYRAQIMLKMDAATLPALVRMAIDLARDG